MPHASKRSALTSCDFISKELFLIFVCFFTVLTEHLFMLVYVLVCVCESNRVKQWGLHCHMSMYLFN